jgi:hypothetical protein
MNKKQMQSPVRHVAHFSGAGAGGAVSGYGPKPPRSSLAQLQLSRPRTSEEMRKMATEVWRSRGLALIDPLLIPDDFARQALINEATRLYGRQSPTARSAVKPVVIADDLRAGL